MQISLNLGKQNQLTLPGNMKIIIDTREQSRLNFKHKSITEVIVKGLNVGDYAALFSADFQPPIVFERKSINDLYGTLSQGYERFKKEIERAKEKNIQIIIIVEGNLSRVLQGCGYSQRTPESIVYQIFTIWVRYGIQTIFCKDSEEMAEYISQFYIAHYKEYQNAKPKQIRPNALHGKGF